MDHRTGRLRTRFGQRSATQRRETATPRSSTAEQEHGRPRSGLTGLTDHDAAPGGFEKFFEELVDADIAAGQPDHAWMASLFARYGIEHDYESVPVLCERFGVSFG